MKGKYVAELRSGDELVDEAFLLQDCVHRVTKDGRTYLLYTLSDRSGQANGIYWDTPDDLESWLRPGQIILVTGRVGHYKDALQVSATDFALEDSPDMTQFLAASRRPRSQMIAELRREINDLGQPWQRLVSHILLDDSFLARFANAPAARKMHHGYIGGLLEHTLSMVTLARLLARHYPHVNEDLLVAGVLLHDVGKVSEYNVETAIDISDDGRLVGHIVRGIIQIEQAAAVLDTFPPEALRQLVHLVSSHHGTLEWGSPVVPKTLEAILLHQIDLLDSRIQGFFDHLGSDSGGALWSVKPSPMFGTELRRPPGFNPDNKA